MARQIFIVRATQVVTSQAHPEGVYQDYPNYPKTLDSRDYGNTDENPNGNEELALIVAKAWYADAVKQLALANNTTRVMWTVTLERADGQNIEKTTWGRFPDMTPTPEEPEE